MTRKQFSFASGMNAKYLEGLYQDYLHGSKDIDEKWKIFFDGYTFGGHHQQGRISADELHENALVENLISAYREFGHLSAEINPLKKSEAPPRNLQLDFHHLDQLPLEQVFHPADLIVSGEKNLSNILLTLKSTYCHSIGVEFRNIHNPEATLWLQEQMETCLNLPSFSKEQQERILDKLIAAEEFERFLQARYLGQKRFSLEGLDALIPLLDQLLRESSKLGVEELCIGMAHRGRLNVLTNILEKDRDVMLHEFEGTEFNPFDIDGDVKYHLGYANQVETEYGALRLYLSPNPSHLEFVNPVLEGFVRARQSRINGGHVNKIIPLLIHGDASFSGQGVVMETLNLSQLKDYYTGGTIHIILNNQIGFTTDPKDSRSSRYSSSIAKIIQAPVLHINMDKPESALWAIGLALNYRQKFHQDIVLDLIGYRRHGHNEGDEPSFTQPHLYKTIARHPSVVKKYKDFLIKSGSLTQDVYDEKTKTYRHHMQEAFQKIRSEKFTKPPMPIPKDLKVSMNTRKVSRTQILETVMTGVNLEKLKTYLKMLTTFPESFVPHPKILKLYKQREQILDGEGAVDWATAELLAFSSMVAEGRCVRLSGQDSQRGTFSSRHVVLHDIEKKEEYLVLSNITREKQGSFTVINSPLSEQGVLGFEFGYSVADPNTLVLWEAQFGDFANGAQIIIDQFIASSEAKWKQTCSLVLLLPHGYEGMGPEHSSARPERFLQLCGNNNIQVVIPTTSAQYFHVLRRQLHRDFRKPLIIMTPKSLLRSPYPISQTKEFTQSGFLEVLDDSSSLDKEKVISLVLCTGKIYYELFETRQESLVQNITAILRIEQLYPFPREILSQNIDRYPHIKEIIWVQEEPKNMGYWNFIEPRLRKIVKDSIEIFYVGRIHSGTPAEGSVKSHKIEQTRIVHHALRLACLWKPSE